MYLHDIIIFFCNADKHISHVCTVKYILHNVGVTFNHKKGPFFFENIDCFGIVIRPEKLELADNGLNTICDSKSPQTITQLILFSDYGTHTLQFVPNFASIVALLNEKLGKGKTRTSDTFIGKGRISNTTALAGINIINSFSMQKGELTFDNDVGNK